MADNVFQFPGEEARCWSAFVTEAESSLLAEGIPAAAAAYALAQIKPIFLDSIQSKSFSGDQESVAAELREWLNQRTLAFMIELLAREVELYSLRGPAT